MKFPEFDEKSTNDRIGEGLKVSMEMGKIKNEEMSFAYLAGAASASRWQYKHLKERFENEAKKVEQ